MSDDLDDRIIRKAYHEALEETYPAMPSKEKMIARIYLSCGLMIGFLMGMLFGMWI